MTERLILLTRWKPYYSAEETLQSISDVVQQLSPEGPLLYAALPYPFLQTADKNRFSDQVMLGVDNMLNTQPGTYAEHFGVKMVQDAQASFVLLGDREARQQLGEDNSTISQKATSALSAGLKVMLCVDEMKAGAAHGLEEQLQSILQATLPEQLSHLSLVYQGPWQTFYSEGHHLVEELSKGLERFREILARVGGEQLLPLLALPSRLTSCQQVVEATAPYCSGYYFPTATMNPSVIANMGKAWDAWSLKAGESSKSVPPSQQDGDAEIEPTQNQS